MSTVNTSHISLNIQHILQRISDAALRAGRHPADITLVAVTKTYPAEFALAAWHAGLRHVGENKVQEGWTKRQALPQAKLHWHLIGHLQTNKARDAVRCFDLIHSVDSDRLAAELNRQALRHEKVQPILIQVNVSGEDTKSGIDPAGLPNLVSTILENYLHLQIDGLMTMAPLDSPEKARPVFAGLKSLLDQLTADFSGHPRFSGQHLSMGMSNDYQVAIEEGATLIRVGTAIFGARDYTIS